MHIRSCHSRLRRQRPRQNPDKSSHPRHSRGQIMVVFAVALLALLFFIGLAVDAGAMYITYGQLKRAVDAAAVAAANDFKSFEGNVNTADRVVSMQQTASEVLRMHNVDPDATTINLKVCDEDSDGLRDADLQTSVPSFYNLCPDTTANESPRKLIYVGANMDAPLYFLHLLGFQTINLNTYSISEAAPIDVVIVLDVSESMGEETTSPTPYDVLGYNPNGGSSGCNPIPIGETGYNPNDPGSCQPLLDAKLAAKALIDSLYPGYDQVSLVTFDSQAIVQPIKNQAGVSVSLSNSMSNAKIAVNAIRLHDDPDRKYRWGMWQGSGRFNPVNPEDRDGDGLDWDSSARTGYTCPNMANVSMSDRWWTYDEGAPLCTDSAGKCTARSTTPGSDAPCDCNAWFGHAAGPDYDFPDPGGLPCDDDALYDAYDWDLDGQFTIADHNTTIQWLADNDPDGGGPMTASLSPLSTCTGCGMRTASGVLETEGRPGAVWVIVFLSDGMANLSDTYNAAVPNNVPPEYPNGFCNGRFGQAQTPPNYSFSAGGYWPFLCTVTDVSRPRYCIDADEDTCPPSTVWQGSTPNTNYSVLDYVYDMTDDAALTKSDNLKEPPGNDIAIYSIALISTPRQNPFFYTAENLLRYMAAVGDDGDRTTDPCRTASNFESCGQYYLAPTSAELVPIFEDIAGRIYTRITN
jgi:Putative Flp pilus-assembly TadE/G-like